MKRLPMLFALWAAMSVTLLAQAVQTGKISGKLTYPSDYIPPELVVCVQNISVSAQPTFCSDSTAARLRQDSISFRVAHRAASYTVTLPAGRYYVYGTFRRGRTPVPEMAGIKAYYNEFVRCGMSVDCHSKRLIEVIVKPGRTVTGITIGDWY